MSAKLRYGSHFGFKEWNNFYYGEIDNFDAMERYYIGLVLLFFPMLLVAQVNCTDTDKALVLQKIEQLNQIDIAETNDGIITIAKTFLGTPYVAKTLEIGETESLVVNLQGLDCTTFVENVLAFGLLQKQGNWTFDDFTKNLKTIRYRNGVLDGYASRLHYFTDWIRNNETKGLVRDITTDLGGNAMDKNINFMGTHRELYPFLQNDENFGQILKTEMELAKEPFCYLPTAQLIAVENQLRSGDIIALATSIKGLDVTHTGFAIRQPSGRIHLLHASISGEVKISEAPLVDYLNKVKNNIGILVARPTR